MSSCLCLSHENQFVEFVCLDNKCKQKLHCNKCVKYFGKDHYLMDLKRVQHSLLRLSLNDKVVTSRNFELADHDLVQFVEGNDPREKQEQYTKSLQQEREEVRKDCMQEIEFSIEKIMKDNQRSLYNLQESLKNCYTKKIDEILSVEQLKNQTFKHKALLLLQNQIKNSNYTDLNESILKLHSGKYELMYAKQQNKQLFFEMQQKINSFIKTQNDLINSFCGQFQSIFQQTIEIAQQHGQRQINGSIKSKLAPQMPKLPSVSIQSSFKNDITIFGPQNKFFSQDLKNLNKVNTMNVISQSQISNFQNHGIPKLSGTRQNESPVKNQQSNAFSMILPSTLSPDNINHSRTYQIRSIGNLDTNSEYYKEFETPFKKNTYLTQSQKTIKPNQSYKRNAFKSRSSFQIDEDNNTYSIPDRSLPQSATNLQNKDKNLFQKNNVTSHTLDSKNNNMNQNSFSIIPNSILNNSNSIHSTNSKLPVLNQTFERKIKSVIQINEKTFVFGTIDGYMKIMEINRNEKCIYELDSKQAHEKLHKLKKCQEENDEILFFSSGIDEGGQNGIKLWQMRKETSEIRQLFILQDLHGRNMIDQVLFLKTDKVQNNQQKIIYFATLSSTNKKQIIKICLAKIDFSLIKTNNQAEQNGKNQSNETPTTSCKVEILSEIVEDLVNKIRKLSHFEMKENRLYAYSSKQIIQYNLDENMQLNKKLVKIIVQNKIDYIKGLIPLNSCIKDIDNIQELPSFVINGQNISDYLLLFSHEGVLKIINSNNLSILKNEINLSSLDKNFSYSSQITKVVVQNEGVCLLAIQNLDDSPQQVFEFNIITNSLRQQTGQFKDKITKFQSISHEQFLSIEDYQDLSIWQLQ